MTTTTAPLVLVHGLIGTLQVPDLLQYFPMGRAIAPDLLGYGSFRDVPPNEISIPEQVRHLHRVVQQHFGSERVHVVGHSVGGLIAMLLAHAHPEQVESVVSVEGNFTLNDAFWSSSVARMQQAEVEQMLVDFRDEPDVWLAGSGIAADANALRVADRWLRYQPATTIQAMARSVVRETSSPEYLVNVRSVFAQHPVYLVAGERSVGDWDVQDWARQQAARFVVIPATGHLMMLERPAEFAAAIADLIRDEGGRPKP